MFEGADGKNVRYCKKCDALIPRPEAIAANARNKNGDLSAQDVADQVGTPAIESR